jgi:carbon-monoxide dehydrogenase small subunit
MIMSAQALLEDNPHRTRDEIKHALAGNICRCTGYVQIFDSVAAVGDAETEEIKAVAWKDGS